MTAPVLRTEALAKGFTLHLRGGKRLDVLAGVDLVVRAGECVALTGPSGAGKSSLLRCLYGTYRADGGRILVRHRDRELDLTAADPRTVLEDRAETIGYVAQFLRVVPRVPALEIVAEAAIARGVAAAPARARARDLLDRLGIPARLHDLPPATFSGGEQQRVNLARGFIAAHPILLLDEPTAALDPANRDAVLALIREARDAGTAIIVIMHDEPARAAIADRLFPLSPIRDAA
ncbi:MAG: phosphonate C-P lyase system protein PhnL [Rhodospirillales bacterium]|nr:phosphonate C-P lyase system protein PhnL [Rhodospirillales bacterium]